MGTPITTGGEIVVAHGWPESTGRALTSEDTGTAVTSAGAAAATGIGALAGTNGMASSRLSSSSLSRLLDLEKPASIFAFWKPRRSATGN